MQPIPDPADRDILTWIFNIYYGNLSELHDRISSQQALKLQ